MRLIQEMPRSADVVIIGGGIVGCATSFFLSRSGRHPVLIERVESDVAIIRAENNLPADTEIPVDLVTASGSGLDPHISPASADLQIARVAQQRGITEEQVRAAFA